jgi:hypothetical protein
MIELNLLPDIKLEYIKAQRTRRLVLSIAVIISIASVALLLLLLSVDGLQKKHLSDLNKDIKNDSQTLKSKPRINQILTVQNQLASLTSLHQSKPAAARLVTYLDQVTPIQVAINTFTIDFTQYTATISGQADTLNSVNQYVDTLKLTNYTTTGNTHPTNAFSNVVLSAFGLTNSTGQAQTKPATYTITLAYDKSIFDITQNATLNVPNRTTTRSGLNDPNALFTNAPPPNGGNH